MLKKMFMALWRRPGKTDRRHVEAERSAMFKTLADMEKKLTGRPADVVPIRESRDRREQVPGRRSTDAKAC